MLHKQLAPKRCSLQRAILWRAANGRGLLFWLSLQLSSKIVR